MNAERWTHFSVHVKHVGPGIEDLPSLSPFWKGQLSWVELASILEQMLKKLFRCGSFALDKEIEESVPNARSESKKALLITDGRSSIGSTPDVVRLCNIATFVENYAISWRDKQRFEQDLKGICTD